MIQTSVGNPVYVREEVFYDATGHIVLSVWGNMMDTIKEDNFYCFTQITLNNYFGKKTGNIKSVATVHKSSKGFVACHHCSRTVRADKCSSLFH